jgi:DNA-binding MarR family transcriptional regulator
MYHIIVSTLNTVPIRSRRSSAVPAEAGDDRALIDAFERLGPAYMRWVRSQLRPEASGVTVARLRILGMLRGFGPKPMGFFAKEAGIAPRTLTTLIDGLEREGLARRLPHPDDRRATLIEITADGERALRACLKPHRDAVTALFRGLPDADRVALARLIPRLVAAIEASATRKS